MGGSPCIASLCSHFAQGTAPQRMRGGTPGLSSEAQTCFPVSYSGFPRLEDTITLIHQLVVVKLFEKESIHSVCLKGYYPSVIYKHLEVQLTLFLKCILFELNRMLLLSCKFQRLLRAIIRLEQSEGMGRKSSGVQG